MIQDENVGLTVFDFLFKGRVLLEYFLEFRVIVLDISDRLCQTGLHIGIVFILEDTSLREITVLKQILME